MKNKKIWQKKSLGELDSLVEDYTVGNDYILDKELIPYDALASIAHAKMLESIGILKKSETRDLVLHLNQIIKLSNSGKFNIDKNEEDGHTAIENYLTKKSGEAGKKIHTGRSRNDQVLVAMRLFMKAKLETSIQEISNLSNQFKVKANAHKGIEMPGYTHMQRAMPSSVSMWLNSFADSLEDDLAIVKSVYSMIDQNPLGSVVGYGETTLGLNRKMTTKLLGFKKTQDNPLYCALSRGKFELAVLSSLSLVMQDIGKFATDMMLFTTKEFGFASLPAQFTTGSSAMPQKRNYDVCELIRAKCSVFPNAVASMASVIDKLPSGYNRDFQITKELFFQGVKSAIDTISIAGVVVKNVKINTESMKLACTPELYATEEAYKLVKNKGVPFREAYKIVAEKYNK
ncbi:MAG: argininosuccinate lyase [Candidatus Pacebacteria bacterium]|nr:argininosuccinate lyase [Candidatus Paceibacterota bacterium]